MTVALVRVVRSLLRVSWANMQVRVGGEGGGGT